jgi:hypothetical protein
MYDMKAGTQKSVYDLDKIYLSFQANLTNFCDFIQRLQANVRMFCILKWAQTCFLQPSLPFHLSRCCGRPAILLQIDLGSSMTDIQYTACSNI